MVTSANSGQNNFTWLESESIWQHLQTLNPSLTLDEDAIQPWASVCGLVVPLDAKLDVGTHVSETVLTYSSAVSHPAMLVKTVLGLSLIAVLSGLLYSSNFRRYGISAAAAEVFA